VNASQVLNHFDRIAEAPDAVQSFRRFVLDLAVRGKLVEQDSNDSPTSTSVVDLTKQEIDDSVPACVPVNDAPFSVPESWS
jgi:type I restriction enzyme S subunit